MGVGVAKATEASATNNEINFKGNIGTFQREKLEVASKPESYIARKNTATDRIRFKKKKSNRSRCISTFSDISEGKGKEATCERNSEEFRYVIPL